MSPSFMIGIRIRRSWKLKSAASAALDIAKGCPERCCPFRRPRSRLRPARIDGVNTPAKTSETSAAPSKQGRTPEPTDLIFPKWPRELFKTILNEKKLRFDREGRPRTAYCLRHTYICMRLMEGADICQIAKNCRTRRRDDREILRSAHQDLARRRCNQRHAAEKIQKLGSDRCSLKQATQGQPSDQKRTCKSWRTCPMIEMQSGSRARAWRNGIRSGLKENLSARLGNRRCRTAQIRGNLKWQSRAKPGETAGKV
jgi:hypothetical protein